MTIQSQCIHGWMDGLVVYGMMNTGIDSPASDSFHEVKM
jgi:hypothetical protein